MNSERVNLTFWVDEELYEKYQSMCTAYGYSPEEDLERFVCFFVDCMKEKIQILKTKP